MWQTIQNIFLEIKVSFDKLMNIWASTGMIYIKNKLRNDEDFGNNTIQEKATAIICTIRRAALSSPFLANVSKF